jgi:DNA-binding NarL/FixJ family response regulator
MVKSETKLERSRLVVADDHQSVLDTVVLILEPEFAIVDTVRDGGALLEAVVRLDPDVVVLDVAMPVLNGLEVARLLREKKLRAKVVFLSVHDDEDFVREALAEGASGYVVKGNMAVELPHAIHEALRGRRFISPCIRFGEA